MASDTKFTPGPWFINRSEMGIHKYVEARIGGGMIQEVACCGPTELHEQSDANARLIAAAPELYEALLTARKELAGLPHSLGYEITHMPAIDLALAKARGDV